MDLLIGCGFSTTRYLSLDRYEWDGLIRADINPLCEPDVIFDLEHTPYPFKDDTFDEIHAYEVLEHCGKQGDYKLFFRQFEEFYRILKPNGLLLGTCPSWDAYWAWADPSHSRIIAQGTLLFLDQNHYSGLGSTHMSDYRHIYGGDLKLIWGEDDKKKGQFAFVLSAAKGPIEGREPAPWKAAR